MTVSKTGGATVTLSSNAAALTVPASVTVGSGSTTATFTATAGTIASNQTATITATLNGSTQTATIALVAPVLLSGLTCSPTSLGSGGVSTCTVTVSKTGGATVTLSDNASALTEPASVTVGSCKHHRDLQGYGGLDPLRHERQAHRYAGKHFPKRDFSSQSLI